MRVPENVLQLEKFKSLVPVGVAVYIDYQKIGTAEFVRITETESQKVLYNDFPVKEQK